MGDADHWADALHMWLGIEGKDIHVVTSGKEADIGSGVAFQFLVVSYAFVSKMKAIRHAILFTRWRIGSRATMRMPLIGIGALMGIGLRRLQRNGSG